MEQATKTKAPSKRAEVDSDQTEETQRDPDAQRLLDELDSLLDEVDDILDDNQETVKDAASDHVDGDMAAIAEFYNQRYRGEETTHSWEYIKVLLKGYNMMTFGPCVC